MNVKIENISNIKKKLSFEVSAEQVDAEIEKAYQKIAKTAKIKGFRPGKIPRSLLEQYYASQMEEQVLSRLINDSYFKALVDHQIAALTDPEIVESGSLERGKPFTYQAQVEIKPEIEVKDYQGLSLQKEKLAFDAKVVDDRLEEMRASRAEMVISSRGEASPGDFVTIDFKGLVDGVPFAGGSAENHVLELGSGSFIPGFEEQVAGMKPGEERKIAVTFPEEYGNKELAGKAVIFEVILKEIKEKTLPDLNDEFAQGFGLASLDELKEKLKENFQTQEVNRIEGDLRERLVAALIERNPVEVPESMVQKQLDYMLENIRNRFKSQGMSLEMLGLTDESFRQMYHPTAVSQVQGSLILEGVARQEKITVEPGEIDGKLAKIAEMANAPLDAVKNYYAKEETRRGLIAQAVEEKTVQFLLENSIIEEVEKEQLKDQGKPTEKE